jgi:dienelactone hydrolase
VPEHAVVFPESGSLVGVFTVAEESGDRKRPAVIFLNAGLLHRVGPNRVYVRIARELARYGFSSLRFDLSGIGDSPPRTDGLPLRAASLRDVTDALDFLSATRGLSSFILIGMCSGADLAFRVALADARVVGAVLIDGFLYRTARSYVYDYTSRVWRLIFLGWRELLTPGGPLWSNLPWSSKKTARATTGGGGRDIPSSSEADSALRELAARGVNLLIVYSEGLGYNYQRQFTDVFPSVPTDRVRVEYFKGADHMFTLLANQDRLVRAARDWIARFR